MEQKIQTTLTKPAKLKYEHGVGATVRVVDIYTDQNGERIFFTAPKVDGLYFEKAKKLCQEASTKRDQVFQSKGPINPTDPTQGIAFVNEEATFDFFSTASAGIILLFSSIEANINAAIERQNNTNTMYVEKSTKTLLSFWKFNIRYKQDHALNVDEMLFKSIDIKVKKILPQLYEIDSPANQDFWVKFVEVKKIRDKLVHSQKEHSYGANKNQNSIYADMFNFNFVEVIDATEKFIQYLDQNTLKT